MTIFLNNEAVVVGKDVSLSEILTDKEFADKKGIAVAVNNSIISKKDWASVALHENDKVLIIKAFKGG